LPENKKIPIEMDPLKVRHQVDVSAEHLVQLKTWFGRYVRSYYSSDPVVQQAVVLKEEHSLRVCREILNIGRKLGLHDSELRIAEVTALFHDIGRFEQYTRYRTFVDNRSENHGELGVKVLLQEKALRDLDEASRDLILRAISYHNRLSIPEDEDASCLFFSRLLRDADKLDIFELVTSYYHADPSERNVAIELDLPDRPDVSEDLLDSLRKGRMIGVQKLQSLNDFKLLQMAWVYDLYFQPTFRMVWDRGYLGKIRDALPPSERIDAIFADMTAYLKQHAGTCIPWKRSACLPRQEGNGCSRQPEGFRRTGLIPPP